MFPTSRLRMMRTRNQKKIQYNYVPYGYVLVTSLSHYNTMCLPILAYPCLSLASQQKPVNAYFYQGDIKDPVYDRLFSYHPLLKTHSNQEHYNTNHQTPFP